MDKCVIVVDNSNLFIEGQKHSAAKKGVKKQNAADRDPCDPSWRIDFGELLMRLAEGRQIHAAILVGSRPPANDSVWKSAQQLGFAVTVHDRDSQHREKAVDTELVAQGTEVICSAPEPMALVIASGDRDFIPLVSVAHRRKWTVEMAAFSSAFGSTGDMATSVDRVRPLELDFDKIGYAAFKWPIP
ncbi:MAG: NYN domain-containing protein [Acidobacteriia bacterium]|nr:NYN domain-containing protein [Terriglobia bacterium]